MTLTCRAAITGEGEPTIQWKKDNVVSNGEYSSSVKACYAQPKYGTVMCIQTWQDCWIVIVWPARVKTRVTNESTCFAWGRYKQERVIVDEGFQTDSTAFYGCGKLGDRVSVMFAEGICQCRLTVQSWTLSGSSGVIQHYTLQLLNTPCQTPTFLWNRPLLIQQTDFITQQTYQYNRPLSVQQIFISTTDFICTTDLYQYNRFLSVQQIFISTSDIIGTIGLNQYNRPFISATDHLSGQQTIISNSNTLQLHNAPH